MLPLSGAAWISLFTSKQTKKNAKLANTIVMAYR